jgi:ferredoxin-NADP reductase
MASSAERGPDGAVEFAIKAVGDWSAGVVPRLAPGTRVWIDGPFGAFTIDRKIAQGFVLIAGGSGIAPFRSMLLTMRDRGDRRHVVLFHAARDETRVLFGQELDALARTLNLDVVRVLEAPSDDWKGARGLITADLLRHHCPPQLGRYGFLVCGPPAMMDAVTSMLVELGVARAAIDTERFTVV